LDATPVDALQLTCRVAGHVVERRLGRPHRYQQQPRLL